MNCCTKVGGGLQGGTLIDDAADDVVEDFRLKPPSVFVEEVPDEFEDPALVALFTIRGCDAFTRLGTE